MDPLSVFDGVSVCNNCGCLQQSGGFRCPECGTFHTSTHLEERTEPLPSPRSREEPVDPTMYSLNPDSEIPVEDAEEVEDMTTHWSGGSSDFHLPDEDDGEFKVKLEAMEVPSAEILFEEE